MPCISRGLRPRTKQYREPGLGEVAICRERLSDVEVRSDEDADAIRQAPIFVRALSEQRKSPREQGAIDGDATPAR